MPSTEISISNGLARVEHALPLEALYGYKQEEMKAVVGANSDDRAMDLEILSISVHIWLLDLEYET